MIPTTGALSRAALVATLLSFALGPASGAHAATSALAASVPASDGNAIGASTLDDLAKRQSSSIAAAPSGTSLADTWTPPLSTRGRYVVDAKGKRFHLRGGNWHGASGTYNGDGDISNPANHHAGELAYQTVLCLDRKPMSELIDDFLALGVNTIRLPFSNEMIHSTATVPASALRANPSLQGKTPLEIYDAVVEALTARGLAVILNNHTVKSLWCCGLDQNSRWNLAQSTSQWIDDWVFLVRRYAANKRVVGAELYNEVRRSLTQDPTWGEGGDPDWFQASLDAGVRIQREASSDILVVVEGERSLHFHTMCLASPLVLTH